MMLCVRLPQGAVVFLVFFKFSQGRVLHFNILFSSLPPSKYGKLLKMRVCNTSSLKWLLVGKLPFS